MEKRPVGRPKSGKVTDNLIKHNLSYQRQIEAYQRKVESLESNYANAELMRLNSEFARLNEEIDRMSGHLHALTNEKNDAVKNAIQHAVLMAKIRKALGVASTKEILPALAALKKKCE